MVDAVGLERFALLGISAGCAVSAIYAVQHPERVSRLVLYGGFAKSWRHCDRPGDIEWREAMEAMALLIRRGWGQDNPAFRQVFTSLLIPEASSEQICWFNDLQRVTTSPENALRLYRVLGEIDVRAILPRVRAPTIVLHCRGDALVPFEDGRELAA